MPKSRQALSRCGQSSQNELAPLGFERMSQMIDLEPFRARDSTCSSRYTDAMPELSRFFGIIIRMYMEVGGPHHLPHFHASYQAG